MRLICTLIFRLMGWKTGSSIPADYPQCVVIAAPHTSNWDLILAIGALEILKIKAKYTIKSEWMRFPFKWLIHSTGGVAVDRSPKKAGEERRSTVDALAELFQTHKELALLVTPEGTRKKATKWRTGFYQVALKANVPILMGYVDYAKKEAGIGTVIHPSPGGFEKDMRIIMDFYAKTTPKFPESFSLDEEFSGKIKGENTN